jgi:hypothetical protein
MFVLCYTLHDPRFHCSVSSILTMRRPQGCPSTCARTTLARVAEPGRAGAGKTG